MFSDEFQLERIGNAQFSDGQYEDYIVEELIKEMPRFTRPEIQEVVRDTIRSAVRQADRYDLHGLARVDFFCLYEFTRRKGSAVHAYQARLLVAPFLNPDSIRAVFGYLDRSDMNVFPRHIIQANAPEWADVPYYEDLEKVKSEKSRPSATLEAHVETTANWKVPKGRRNYDGALYWQTAGKPLVAEALRQGGFWTEVFDPILARGSQIDNADALAILHLLPRALREGTS